MHKNEYTKLSLHNHFGSDKHKSFDMEHKGRKREDLKYDWKTSREILMDSYRENFKMLGVTNSNQFSFFEYILLRNMANRLGIELLPGIEINVENPEDSTRYAHAVIIFSDKYGLFNLQSDIEKIVTNPATSTKLKDIVEVLLIKRKSLVMVHGKKQDKDKRSLTANHELVAEYMCFEDNSYYIRPILLEDTRDFHKITLIEEMKSLMINQTELNWLENTSTTTHADRELPSKIKNPNYLWGNNTFDDLYYASLLKNEISKMPRILNEEDIINKLDFISKIEIKKQDSINEVDIELSHGLNTIVGPSGSGKTLLLNTIYKKVKDDDLECVKNLGVDYKDVIDYNLVNLYNKKGNIISKNDINIYEGKKIYDTIISAYKKSRSEALQLLGYEVDKKEFKKLLSEFNKHINHYLEMKTKVDELESKNTNSIATLSANLSYLKENPKGKSISYTSDLTLDQNLEEINNSLRKHIKDVKTFKESIEVLIGLSAHYKFDDIVEKLENITKDFENRIEAQLIKLSKQKNEYEITHL